MPEFSLKELAKKIRGELHGDGDIKITGAEKIETASPGCITFLVNPKYIPKLSETRASVVIVDQKIDVEIPIPFIRVDDAYFRFLQVFLLFHPQKAISEPGIHPTAVIPESAKIGEGVAIGAHVVLGKDCVIGAHTRILANCVLMDGVRIGKDCLLYPLVSIRETCEVGDRAIIHSGAVIGSDGFGFAPFEGTFHKIPQVGRVIIENDVEIGANATIDRATMGETIIRNGVKLDDQVHIAHNVEIGESTVMAAQTGISGSTKIGHHVIMAGQVGLVGHIEIGNFAQFGAQAGVTNNVPEKQIVWGTPSRPLVRSNRIEAAHNKLPELLKRVRKLEKKLEKLEGGKEKSS